MRDFFKGIIDYIHLYLTKSRSPLYSFLFVMPLLLLYEFLILQTGSTVRNGADVLLKVLISFLGVKGIAGFSIIIFITFCYVIYRDTIQGNEHVSSSFFLIMTGEAALYAIILGPLVAKITNKILYSKLSSVSGVTIKEQLIVSLGAGIYEEFVFRFVLVSILIYAFSRFMDVPKFASIGFAIVWASFFFSGFHYVGVYAYDFQISTFLFRFLAGMILSFLYYFRGFGIAVYAHTFYDIFISLALVG